VRDTAPSFFLFLCRLSLFISVFISVQGMEVLFPSTLFYLFFVSLTFSDGTKVPQAKRRDSLTVHLFPCSCLRVCQLLLLPLPSSISFIWRKVKMISTGRDRECLMKTFLFHSSHSLQESNKKPTLNCIPGHNHHTTQERTLEEKDVWLLVDIMQVHTNNTNRLK